MYVRVAMGDKARRDKTRVTRRRSVMPGCDAGHNGVIRVMKTGGSGGSVKRLAVL